MGTSSCHDEHLVPARKRSLFVRLCLVFVCVGVFGCVFGLWQGQGGHMSRAWNPPGPHGKMAMEGNPWLAAPWSTAQPKECDFKSDIGFV